jgi:hypothetical protein
MTRLPATATLTVRGPDSLPALVPHLVGFHPTESLVLLGLGNERHAVRVTMRLDLPHADDDVVGVVDGWAASLAALPQAGATEVILAVYPGAERDPWRGAEPGDLPHVDLVDELAAELSDAGIVALDAVCVVGDRIRSYWCDSLSCCPREGRLVDVAESLRVRATLVVHGSAPLSSRDALVHSLDERPLDDPVRRAVDRARDGVVIRMPSGTRQRVEHVVTGARALADDPRNEATLVRLVVMVAWLCARIRPRDLLLRALTVDQDRRLLASARALLTEAVRCASGAEVAPVASVLAVCAWVDGDGAAARVALDRALDADPAYSLAALVSAALDAGTPPWAWAAMMAETSVEEILGEIPPRVEEPGDWASTGA